MVNNSQRTSAFTVLALITAGLLLAAALTLFLQSGEDAPAEPVSAELALLSQAIPLHATNAVAGDNAAFDRLEQGLARLEALRASDAALPGDAEAWNDLLRHGRAILASRSDFETISAVASNVSSRMPQMLAEIEALGVQAEAPAVLQGLEQRAVALQQDVNRLATSRDPAAAAPAVVADAAYLRQVTDALAGRSTALDIAPVDEAVRETALTPLLETLADIEARVERSLAAVANVGDPAATLAALAGSASALETAAAAVPPAAETGLQESKLPLILVIVALLLLGALAYIYSRAARFERASLEQAERNERNQQAILRLLDELGSLADGDLTVEATVTEDITGAIADSINYAIEKLRELVATINETAIMVDSAAKQTDSTAQHMARSAENQNQEIRAATESIMSMAASIEEVSGNAERSSDVARHSVEVAHKGGDAVRRTIDGMNAIRETIQDTSKRIKRLGESSQEIGNIVELINDIAEQTNILALNASIQASMAGEAGRGFAVVADEVQRLAERSTNATKQIEVLVRTIQSDTNEAVVSMERSTTDVVGGALLAENAGAALDEIEQVSNQIASLVQNISSSAREQASSAADVTRRTRRLKEISDETGRATAATAEAISKFSELASQLRQTVSGFTLPKSVFSRRSLAPRTVATEAREEAEDTVAS